MSGELVPIERRNYDFEQLASCITELLLLLLLRQSLLRRASYMVTDIVELFSVAVKPSLLSHAIKSSLPCSSFESVPLIVTTQRTLGFGQGRI